MQPHYKKELKVPKSEKEACEVLGINGKLIQEEINKAYKKLLLIYHPDKHSDCDKSCKDLADTSAKALNKAKTLLTSILEEECNTRACNEGSNETSKAECNKKDIKPNIANSFINKNLERARKLIKQEVKIKNILGFFIKNACEDNDWYEFLKEFLSEQGSKVDLDMCVLIVSDTFESIESTVLYYACIQKNKSVTELLLRYKADVNKVSPRSAYKVPICSALKDNDHGLASLLFQYGARIDVTTEVEQKIIDNSSQYTKETMEVLLQYTSLEQNTEILKRFSGSNISTNIDIEIVQLLLDKGANFNYGDSSAMQAAAARGNTQLEQLFHNYLAGQFKNLQEEKSKAPFAVVQKEGTMRSKYDETNGETTTPLTIEEVNSRTKIVEVLTLNSTAPSGNIRNQLQAKEVEVAQDFVQDADINNNQVMKQPNRILSNGSSINTQTNSKIYSISVGCGMVIGITIAYLAGAATLTPAIAAVVVFIAVAAVGALVGYGIGKFCEKVSEEKQKDSYMSISTAINNAFTSRLKQTLEVLP